MPSLDNAHSLLVSVMRGGRGMFVGRVGARPDKPLEIYEFEVCPYCRKVREAMSELDLEYICRTVAKGSPSGKALAERGGKKTVPFLIDPNTGAEMYESEDIIDYLHAQYGAGRSPAWRTFSAGLASLMRPYGGRARSRRETQPEQLLELYNFEASPYCRKVREKFNALDLDYRVRNVGKRSKRRRELVERGGKMMVPYLVDPNTGTEMYESDDICAYLDRTYG